MGFGAIKAIYICKVIIVIIILTHAGTNSNDSINLITHFLNLQHLEDTASDDGGDKEDLSTYLKYKSQ